MTSTDHFPRPFQSFEHPTSTIRVIAFLEGAKPDSGGAASNGLRLYKSHRRRWKNVKAKEPCRVWGLNSAALVHYVDRSWHMQHMHEVAWTLKKRNCLRHLWNSFWRWLTPSHKTNPTRVQVAKIATLAPAMVFQLACARRAWLGQKPLQTNTLYHIYNM